jgi:uncharacterized protein (TIGR03084 family)
VNDRLAGVLDDLAAEGAALDALVAPLDDSGWRTPTPAAGWDVATTIAHLAWTDEVAAVAATDKAAWDTLVLRALEDPAELVDAEALEGGAVPPAELLDRWRTARTRLAATLQGCADGTRIPWFGPPMSATSMASARFMETWAHALDVAEALGATVEPHDRVRHVVHLGVRTRSYSFANRGLAVPPVEPRLVLTAPSGEVWEHGPADAPESVTGPAWDFALVVTQRRHRADTALVTTGEGAEQWLAVAQAFAGPSGPGRAPSGRGA